MFRLVFTIHKVEGEKEKGDCILTADLKKDFADKYVDIVSR